VCLWVTNVLAYYSNLKIEQKKFYNVENCLIVELKGFEWNSLEKEVELIHESMEY